APGLEHRRFRGIGAGCRRSGAASDRRASRIGGRAWRGQRNDRTPPHGYRGGPPSMSAASEALEPGPASLADEPVEGWQRLAGTLAVSLATFMCVLDISIANVSLPAIAGDLGVSPTQGTWIITS